jgi:hypothetical protein
MTTPRLSSPAATSQLMHAVRVRTRQRATATASGPPNAIVSRHWISLSTSVSPGTAGRDAAARFRLRRGRGQRRDRSGSGMRRWGQVDIQRARASRSGARPLRPSRPADISGSTDTGRSGQPGAVRSTRTRAWRLDRLVTRPEAQTRVCVVRARPAKCSTVRAGATRRGHGGSRVGDMVKAAAALRPSRHAPVGSPGQPPSRPHLSQRPLPSRRRLDDRGVRPPCRGGLQSGRRPCRRSRAGVVGLRVHRCRDLHADPRFDDPRRTGEQSQHVGGARPLSRDHPFRDRAGPGRSSSQRQDVPVRHRPRHCPARGHPRRPGCGGCHARG